MPDQLIAFFWLASAIAAPFVGAARGRPGEGVLLGVFLGPLGLLAAGLLPRTPENQVQYDLDVAAEHARLRALELVEQELREHARQQQLERAESERTARAAQAQPREVVCPVCQRPSTIAGNARAVPCPHCGELLSAKLAGAALE